MYKYLEEIACITAKTSTRNGFDLDSTRPQLAQEKSARSKQLDRWKEFEARRCENQAIARHAKASIWTGAAGLCREDEALKGVGFSQCRHGNRKWCSHTKARHAKSTQNRNSTEDWLLETYIEKEEGIVDTATTTTDQEVRRTAWNQWKELYNQFLASTTSGVPGLRPVNMVVNVSLTVM